MKKVLFFCAFTIAISSCTQYSSEYKQTKQENDSLKLQLTKSEVEMNEMLSILNDIESDIQSIREAEDFISIQKNSELSQSKRSQIRSNMLLIAETLKKNKQQLAELQVKLNNSNIQSTALQKTIDRLTKDITDKSELIVSLQNELNKKDESIKELSAHVEDLNIDIKILENINESKDEKISEQDKALNKVFYCFGTKKELKEQNILTGGGLFSKAKTLQGDFNKDYFIPADKRQVRTIQLFSKKANVKTNHPEDSYSLFKDPDGNLVFEITNRTLFWSLSSYLVIEVG